jgi:pimeloyl-ACP methyl ester carboxylesterase
MTSVAVGGIVAEVEGDGFPVIMIHGLGATSNMFQPQMETLRPYRVIRVDLPGSGRSPVPAEMPTFEGFAEQVVGVAKLLGVTQTHFSHSMGTIVCRGLQHPRQIWCADDPFGALAEPVERHARDWARAPSAQARAYARSPTRSSPAPVPLLAQPSRSRGFVPESIMRRTGGLRKDLRGARRGPRRRAADLHAGCSSRAATARQPAALPGTARKDHRREPPPVRGATLAAGRETGRM